MLSQEDKLNQAQCDVCGEVDIGNCAIAEFISELSIMVTGWRRVILPEVTKNYY
ncbi:MAG: hypothetical protein LBT47_13190 [Deltaproteobacteria bacterium]|nr:hypothetical protein [Deltaproteobacteria bacterium]